eukprot:5479434-Alexandrium_andersonii.AAC.1
MLNQPRCTRARSGHQGDALLAKCAGGGSLHPERPPHIRPRPPRKTACRARRASASAQLSFAPSGAPASWSLWDPPAKEDIGRREHEVTQDQVT